MRRSLEPGLGGVVSLESRPSGRDCGLARDHTPRPGLKQTLVAAIGLHWGGVPVILKELGHCWQKLTGCSSPAGGKNE